MASAHFFEGRLDGKPIDLWLSFEDLAPFRLAGASDGWRLEVDETPPEPVDMEKFGEIFLVDVSKKTMFEPMIGRRLKEVWLVESPSEETIGVRFDFGLPTRPIVINGDDELHVVADYPPESWGEEVPRAAMHPVTSG